MTAGLLKLADGASERFRFERRSPAPLGDRELALKVQQILLAPATHTRRKIWEFDTNLHCSIIGTCLTTSELRQALGKLGCGDIATATEHEVHASGVRTANRRHDGAKLLHKTLDRRHRVTINRFDKAKTADDVQALWRDAVQQGDIPGAYWAALTHPATNDGLVREIFTEVHMLSHLVGAANRADIRRLRQLEEEKAALEAKIERQQRHLREVSLSRDATIRDLTRALEERIGRDHGAENIPAANEAGFAALAADLNGRLARSENRRERAERQLAECRAVLAAERKAHEATERREDDLRHELEAIEASLATADATVCAGKETAELRWSNVALCRRPAGGDRPFAGGGGARGRDLPAS